MGRKPKKPPEHYNFESRARVEKDKWGKWKHVFTNPKTEKQETDTTAQIMYSMVISEAFLDLTARQRMLYVYAKMQFFGARSRPCNDFKEVPEFQDYQGKKYFYLNRKLMSDVYGLYGKESRKLYDDIDALIQHGFLKRYSQGGSIRNGNHMRSIYYFSDEWKTWQQEGHEPEN